MEFEIPSTIMYEHKILHAGLHKVIRSDGNIGKAAEDVLQIFHEHFDKEEKYVLPQLSLLSLLAEDKISSEMKEMIPLTERLKKELPEMLEEHKKISSALSNLIEVAKRENESEAIEFAEDLMRHAKTEEEILYPAAILIGEFLKLKLGLSLTVTK